MMVPAVTTSPSPNFTRAKSLASASVAKVRVDRRLRLLTKVPLLGTTNVTYQVLGIRLPEGRFTPTPLTTGSDPGTIGPMDIVPKGMPLIAPEPDSPRPDVLQRSLTFPFAVPIGRAITAPPKCFAQK